MYNLQRKSQLRTNQASNEISLDSIKQTSFYQDQFLKADRNKNQTIEDIKLSVHPMLKTLPAD